MQFIPKGKPLAVTCDQRAIPEFPMLLFCKPDDGFWFDATAALEGSGRDPLLFLRQYSCQIEAILPSYGIEADGVCRMDTRGHVLIEGHMAYLFISFTDPGFLAWLLDRCHELFTEGVAVSDSYLYRNARARLPQEVLMDGKDDGRADA